MTRHLLLFPLLAVLVQLAHGEGFRNPPSGSYGLGQSGGRIVFVDDATANMHNPANLNELSDPSIVLAPMFVHLSSEYSHDAGGEGETENPLKILPNLFAAYPIQEGKLTAGLGVSVPYGVSTEWEKEGVFGPGGVLRYTTPYFAEMKTIQINPNLAYRINDKLSVAAGLDVMWSELSLKQKYFFPGLVTAETTAEGDTDGWGVGANLALSWDITPNDRLSITWRSPIDIDYSGDASIGNLTPVAAGLGATPRSDLDTEIEFPQIITVGLGHKFSNKTSIEAQLEVVDFSDFEELALDLGNNNPLFGGGITIPQDWERIITVGAGLGHQLTSKDRLHLSYQYFESPVPDSTLSATIPDANQHVGTIGVTRSMSDWILGIAYSYVHYADREVTNLQLDGEIETRLHLLSFTAGWRF